MLLVNTIEICRTRFEDHKVTEIAFMMDNSHHC